LYIITNISILWLRMQDQKVQLPDNQVHTTETKEQSTVRIQMSTDYARNKCSERHIRPRGYGYDKLSASMAYPDPGLRWRIIEGTTQPVLARESEPSKFTQYSRGGYLTHHRALTPAPVR
jgi:hypothetical protein